MMTVLECIEARKSIRSFENREIEAEKLDKVLEAGRLAPSASNRQTWKFIVVQNENLRNKMIEACSNQEFVGEAPAILVVCAEPHVMRCKQDAATIDASIALSFMMLEAEEQGLGTCWIGAFYEEKVRKLLKVPNDYQIVALAPIGYPAETGTEHLRKDRSEIISYDNFRYL